MIIMKPGDIVPFDVFNRVARAEWDTLLFFYGVVMCVGGLGFIGYLSKASGIMYTFFGVLRWTPVIALGYIASILVHMWINAVYF